MLLDQTFTAMLHANTTIAIPDPCNPVASLPVNSLVGAEDADSVLLCNDSFDLTPSTRSHTLIAILSALWLAHPAHASLAARLPITANHRAEHPK